MSSAGGPQPPRHRRRWPRRLLLISAVLAAYPAFVLGTVYTVTLRSELPGGRNGPRDAYRHSLASAVVAYTGWPAWVDWVTALTEGEAQRASRRMDAHNNRIAARIVWLPTSRWGEQDW